MNDRGMTNHPEKIRAEAGASGDSSGGNSSTILDEAADILRRYYGADMESLFVERVVVGVLFTGVKLSNGCGGVAYTPPETVRRASRHILRGEASSAGKISWMGERSITRERRFANPASGREIIIPSLPRSLSDLKGTHCLNRLYY